MNFLNRKAKFQKHYLWDELVIAIRLELQLVENLINNFHFTLVKCANICLGTKMQAEKIDTETEKNDTKVEKNEEAGEKSESGEDGVANKVASLKLEEETGSSTPNSPSTTQPGSFLSSFKAFSKFGDPKSDGKLITLSQSDKWMKQAKVIDGKKITTTDTGIYFKKHK